MDNLFNYLWSAAILLIFIRPSYEVPWRGRTTEESDLVSKLEQLHIQAPKKTRETVPEAPECKDGDCDMAAVVQDLSRYLYHQHTSHTHEHQSAELSYRGLDLSTNEVRTPNTGPATGNDLCPPASPLQCGVPRVSPSVPDIDKLSSPVIIRTEEEGNLVRHGQVLVRYGKNPLFPILKVVGGSEALAHSWPWQISMNVYGMHFCGGAIIHKRWVVTAAHCAAASWVAGYVKVSCGKHDMALYEGEQRVDINRVILHDRYNRRSHENDIALLELKKDIVFNKDVSPICLPSADVQPGQICMTTGWGLTKGTGPANVLNQVALPVIDLATCGQKDWNGDRILNDNVFCAGYEGGSKDACSGDSGGPYACRTGGSWQLNGIISWGYGCALPKKPGVYTRIAKYVAWIEAKTAGAVTSSSSNTA